MNITYNNLSSPSNILTFTDVPNILKLEENITGVKANIDLDFEGDLRQTVTADSQYYITILGETITNVMDASKANNKRFYISGDEDGTAMSVARALRNCGGLAADFNIIHSGPSVYIRAKTIGKKLNNISQAILRNIPSDKLTVSAQDGSAYSVYFNSKIDVDVYKSNSANDEDNYVTTLEKNWYGNQCSFDMSPVLATLSEYGETRPYTFSINLIREDGEWQWVGNVTGNTTVGYLANESNKYLYASGVQPLIVNKRGMSRNIILYTYSNTIPYSVLCGMDTGGWSVIVSAKDSAMNEIYNSGTITYRRTSSNMIVDAEATVPTQYFNDAYYIDLTVGTQTVRFNVIKPLKATEYFQRVEWRNQYGGISFFDFTGARSETDSVDIETYEKNIFDYYETDEFEKKKIYKNDYKKTVKLTSHLMEADGRWIFNSLMRSKKVWTVVNGEKFYIIPKSIEVTEDQTYNNIYTATLTYEYSDIA